MSEGVNNIVDCAAVGVVADGGSKEMNIQL